MMKILDLDKNWRADDEFFLSPGFVVIISELVVDFVLLGVIVEVLFVVVLGVFWYGGVFNLSL